MDNDVLLRVENVSKIFCRDLKRSLWYGLQDIVRDMTCQERHLSPGSNDDLRKKEFWALRGVSFQLRRGRCIGLIGRNGAGKSTLLKLVNGLIKPDTGRITVNGRVGALIQLGAGFNPILTGLENIYNNAAVLGIGKVEVDRRLDEIVEFSEIGKFLHTPVQHYSSGMKVRLGFAVAAQLQPDILLIDEVLAVGDLGFKIKCLNAVNKMLKDTAVIFVSHTMQFVSRICTDIMVLENGQSVYYGDDVGMGIDHYYSEFQKPVRKTMGSGKAEIYNIRISSSDKKVCDQDVLFLKYGDELTVEFTVKTDCSVKDPTVKIFFLDRELRPVAESYSKNGHLSLNGCTEETTLRIHFQKLLFNAGIYFVSVSVFDESEHDEILCRKDYVASFQVQQQQRSWASFLLEGRWESYPADTTASSDN